MHKETDEKIAVEITKEAKGKYPDLYSCSIIAVRKRKNNLSESIENKVTKSEINMIQG